MKNYTVFEPNDPPEDAYDRVEKFVLVPDGFSWLAFFVPIVWAAINRAWLVLAAYVAIAIGLDFALRTLNVHPAAVGIVGIFLNLLLALEAHNVLRWTLKRKNYREVGLVSGPSKDACELQFLKSWADSLEPNEPASANAAPTA